MEGRGAESCTLTKYRQRFHQKSPLAILGKEVYFLLGTGKP